MGWIKTADEKEAARKKRLGKSLFKDQREKVEVALQGGADPNTVNEYGYTALCSHVSSRNHDIAALLLENGANPNGVSSNNYTALMSAAGNGDLKIVKMLVERGANMNDQSDDGRSALHHAAYWGRGKVIEYLIAQGADLTLRDGHMNTAADLAAKRDHPGITSLLRGDLAGKDAATDDQATGWKKTSPHEIALVSDKPAIGYRMTEIFNFRAAHYTHIASNLTTGAESQSQRSFDTFGDAVVLREAMQELLARGGEVDAEVQAKFSGKLTVPRGLSIGSGS